jgi:hypothetical protein
MKNIALVILLPSLFASNAWSQRAFQNLNFEAASIPTNTQQGATVPQSSAMPGWTTSTGSVVYDGASTGGATVSITDANISLYSFVPLQGQYSAMLFAGPDGPAGDCSISQTGLVPISAQSILMDIESPVSFFPMAGFTVVLGVDTISMTPIEQFSTYTLYGGNIPAVLAGQTEALTITALPPVFPTVPPSALAVDAIQFSFPPVPEPGALALLATGAVFLGLRRNKCQCSL